jgi:hypothetical protein
MSNGLNNRYAKKRRRSVADANYPNLGPGARHPFDVENQFYRRHRMLVGLLLRSKEASHRPPHWSPVDVERDFQRRNRELRGIVGMPWDQAQPSPLAEPPTS